MSISSSGGSIGPGAGTRNGNGGLATYGSPFFDPSSQYLPPSYKEMFRWCSFLAHSNSTISPIIKKKASYSITKLVYNSDNQVAVNGWKDLLESNLRLPEMEYKLLLDYETYGNAFCSVFYPFDRYLVCPHCEEETLARTMKWAYKNHEFEGSCLSCKKTAKFTAKDRHVNNRARVKLIRWYPKYIDIDYNPFSDTSTYIYRIPSQVRKRIADSSHGRNKDLVSETPLSVLKAVKEKSNIKLRSDNIYHMKHEGISHEDQAFGMPPILPVFKDVWLHQTYRKAQESIALDHVLPMTLLSPATTSGGVSPHASIDLASWSNKMQSIVRKWRRDQNGIFTVPFPAQVENIRGDAQALNVHNDMTQLQQAIAGGLDVPLDMIQGGLSYSGSSISLRILENLFIQRKNTLDRFVTEFVVPKMRAYSDLPPVVIHHRDFKMADDAQQKQIALGLRQTNTISDRTTIEELGFEFEDEKIRRAAEEKDRLDNAERQQLRQAEIQGQVMVLNARYQAMAEAEQQRVAEQESQASKSDGYSGARNEAAMQSAAPTAPPMDATGDPALLDAMANDFLKSKDPLSQQQELAQLQQSNPMLARAINKRISMIQTQVRDNKPAPEQKPSRSPSSPL
jgi:hypothetical protein